MSVILAALPVAIWVYLILGRGFFWRIVPFDARATPLGDEHRIAVIIPARDEAAGIRKVIESWKSQLYEGPLRIFIVDDHSSDGTAAIAVQAIGDSERIRLIHAGGKPPGWTGKLWALSNGVSAAREFAPDFYLFSDADITHAPETLRALVSQSRLGDYDLVSLIVRLHCRTFAEKALIPAFVFFFFLLYPPRWIQNRRLQTAGAAGGCMLLRRSALERAGGIESIRNAVIDDCALARMIKRTGGRVCLAPADSSHSLRVYAGFGEIGSMIARSAFTQLRYSASLLAATSAGLVATYMSPLVFALCGHGAARAAGMAAWLMMSAAYLPTVRYYRISPLWSITLPAVALFYAGATVHSAIRYWQGRGGEWKGRVTAGNLL